MDKVYFDIRCTIYKWQLISALLAEGPARIRITDTEVGYLQSVEREDGSGNNFNITFTDGNGNEFTEYHWMPF